MRIPDKVIMFRATVQLDQGGMRVFNCYRIQHSDVLGCYKGGIRFHPDVDLDEVKALRARGDLQPDLPALRCVGYRQAWQALDEGWPLAELREPVDSFFEHVTVNAEDPALRENRLRLLSEIRAVTMNVADFSKVAG